MVCLLSGRSLPSSSIGLIFSFIQLSSLSIYTLHSSKRFSLFELHKKRIPPSHVFSYTLQSFSFREFTTIKGFYFVCLLNFFIIYASLGRFMSVGPYMFYLLYSS